MLDARNLRFQKQVVELKMVTTRKKKIIKIALLLALWFLVADAYWMSKAREVGNCIVDKSNELVSKNLHQNYFDIRNDVDDSQHFRAAEMVEFHCSIAQGVTSYWNHIDGMAYWEILLTLPVIHRYRFD